MKRTRALQLTLMTSMPAMLVACMDADLDFDKKYKRSHYATRIECQRAYQSIPNACTTSARGGFFGPYTAFMSGKTRYLPYTAAGKVSERGYAYDPKTKSFTTYNAPDAARALSRASTTRAGFGSTARSGSSGSSIGG